MFSSETATHERLNKKSVIKYTSNVVDGKEITNEISAVQLMERLFLNKIPDGDIANNMNWYDFLNEYEFIYDSQRDYVLWIVRDIRLRIRKFWYTAPCYVAFPLRYGHFDWAPEVLRYLQKAEPVSYLRDAPPEDAYELCENPFFTFYHPHVDNGGNACYGRWHENIVDSQYNSPYQQLETIRGFLNDYNGRSTFFSVDAYMWDTKIQDENTNETLRGFVYPYGALNLVRKGAPEKAIALDRSLRQVFGEDWIIQFCEDTGRNAIIWERVLNWYIYEDNSELMEKEPWAFEHMVDDIHKQAEIVLAPFARYPHGDISGDEWAEQYSKYVTWTDSISHLTDRRVSSAVCQWITSKSGYDWTLGDMHAFMQGVSTWYRQNWGNVLDDFKQNYLKTYVSRRPMGYGLLNVLSNFGQHEWNRSSQRVCGNYTTMLMVLGKNPELDTIMDSHARWEVSSRLSDSTGEWELITRDFTIATNHDYDKLEEESMLLAGRCYWNDDGTFTDGSMSYYTHDDHPNFAWVDYWNMKMKRACESMSKTGRYAPMSHTQDFVGMILIPDTLVLRNHNWDGYYPQEKLTNSEIWQQLFSYCLRNCSLIGPYRSFVIEMLSKSELADEDDREIFMDAMHGNLHDYDSDMQELVLDSFIGWFYKVFPEFPKSIDEVKELRYMIDVEIIKLAYNSWKDHYKQKYEEYENVLTSTTKSVEQGDLFSKQIPV